MGLTMGSEELAQHMTQLLHEELERKLGLVSAASCVAAHCSLPDGRRPWVCTSMQFQPLPSSRCQQPSRMQTQGLRPSGAIAQSCHVLYVHSLCLCASKSIWVAADCRHSMSAIQQIVRSYALRFFMMYEAKWMQSHKVCTTCTLTVLRRVTDRHDGLVLHLV